MNENQTKNKLSRFRDFPLCLVIGVQSNPLRNDPIYREYSVRVNDARTNIIVKVKNMNNRRNTKFKPLMQHVHRMYLFSLVKVGSTSCIYYGGLTK